MVEVGVTVEKSSSDGGIFLQKDIDFGRNWADIPGPWKTSSVEYFTQSHKIDPEYRKLTDVQVELSSTDLEAYRSDESTEALENLGDKLNHSDSEIVVVLIEYPSGQEIDSREMRTILDIQSEYGDVLSTPIQRNLIEALSPFMENGELNLDHSPYDAIYPTTRRFIENASDYAEPSMGILPLIGWQRRRELLRDYERAGINLLGLDFRGFKPTKPEMFDQHLKLIGDLAARDKELESVLYAFNYKSYHTPPNSAPIPSEAIALATFGVDILGGSHVNRGVGGDGKITDVKIFNSNEFLFSRVPLDSPDQFPGQTNIVEPSTLLQYGYEKRTNLRRIINDQRISISLKKLRAAIQNGEERGFMQGKAGYMGGFKDQSEAMARRYDDAKQENVEG